MRNFEAPCLRII